MARTNPLSNPDFAKQVAEAFVAGASRRAMADMFGVKDLDTITRWRRDPRVKVLAAKLTEDRVLQVTRKVDGVIAAKLEEASNMTVMELLAIRKEFLGGGARAKLDNVDEGTIGEAQDLIEKNPDFMEQLESIISKSN